MGRAVFLDRDGTINVDYGYVHEIDKFKYIDGAIEGLKILVDLGFELYIVSNQSGIGRGYYSEEEYLNLTNYMVNDLLNKGIHIKEVVYCPHLDSDNCECRKPKLKLFYDLINKYKIDIKGSYAIGDRERDIQISKQEEIIGILLTDEKKENYICKKNLNDAAKYIRSRCK